MGISEFKIIIDKKIKLKKFFYYLKKNNIPKNLTENSICKTKKK